MITIRCTAYRIATVIFPSRSWRAAAVTSLLLALSPADAALTVPIEAQMPGTQPGEIGNLESVTRCDNCHQSTSPVVTLAHEWRGSMMSHAARDPLFWATVAIAEQDFDGSGDLCIRCHTMTGWLEGRSTPTDGSALTAADASEGVGCDVCHKMTNPDNSEHLGVQNAPFIANDGGSPSAIGYYGSGQLSMSDNSAKLGPYDDAVPKHQWDQSLFHRSVDFCGACHDVSNPVVGDLAPNNGAQQPLPLADQGDKFGGTTVEQKAAFNYFPYQYGVVERTYSEYKSSKFPETPVSDYDDPTFPPELKAGAIQLARNAAALAETGGNYADGTTRYFSCQSCHMRPYVGLGANKQGVPLRPDQPSHDLTGGNYWIPEVMQYMDTANTLLLGGGLSPDEVAGMNAGIQRAKSNLESAAALSVNGNTLRVTNLTGHKLISGYPEGRRMWLNIVWKDSGGATLREDGQYGALQLAFDINDDGLVNSADTVNTLLDLDDPNTRIYEAHAAITQDWASLLAGLPGADLSMPVSFDRVTGTVLVTLGDAAGPGQEPGAYHESFHFVLNNTVVKDNRIPPWGMRYDDAVMRNIVPVPANQYGNPGSGGVYNHWDDVTLNPPAGAASATITLKYQPTSWEYIQFLFLANNQQNAFLANEGVNLLNAWLNTGMAAPHDMATINWTPPDSDGDGIVDTLDNCPDDPNTDQLDTDSDGQGDVCDNDDDDDGLSDTEESVIGTNPLLVDTDGDTLTDAFEVNYHGDSAYTPGEDLNPLLADTDGDTLRDDQDPIPLTFNWADGDAAPLGAPDGEVNAGDLVICLRIISGQLIASDLERAHLDLYPEGAPDGIINLSDLLKLQALVLQ